EGHGGYVHPGAQALRLAANRERVVEVLRRLRVDREGEEVAQVDASLGGRLGRVVRLGRHAEALLGEEPVERRVDRARRPENALESRPAPAAPDDGEIPWASVAESFPVEDERGAGREERLPDDELSAPLDLDDEATLRGRSVTHLAR